MSPAKIETLTGNDERTTPRVLFERLDRWWRFDLDAFASHDNALCDTYCTRDDGTWGRTDTYWKHRRVDDADGLTFPWAGHRVFMNPPYSRAMISAAVAKAFDERNSAQCIVALLPFDPSTQWWQTYIGLHGEHAIVEPVPYRVRFGPGSGAGAPFPSAVVVWRPVL